MRSKVILISVLLGYALSLNAGHKYAPYPILFVHGAGSNKTASYALFGIYHEKDNPDVQENYHNGLGQYFYGPYKINPNFGYFRYDPDTSRTEITSFDTLGPYLHAFSFKRNVRFCIPLTGCENKADGSIDYDPDGSHYVDGKPYEGQGAEVVKFCKLVLDKRGG